MELRALLFTPDGGSTATLCRILTDLGIEAEICSEMLVGVERISRENYDAIIVDWDLETESMFLLKTAREQKAFGLNLALVQEDAAIARALQHGANSTIKKPIDVALAHDTLSTARDLILSRRTERNNKENRAAAIAAEPKAVPEPPSEETLQKSGYLAQSLTRSAFEAEEKVAKPDTSGELHWQAARGLASLQEEPSSEKEVRPVDEKGWQKVKTIFRGTAEDETPVSTSDTADVTGVFSSAPEEPEAEQEASPEPEKSGVPSYLVFAVVGCLLVAAVLYVFAPGGFHLGSVKSALHEFASKSHAGTSKPAARPEPSATADSEDSGAPTVDTRIVDEPAADLGPIPSTEVDPSKIQIIETKAIPKAGAQLPPTTEPTPGSDPALGQTQADPTPPAPDQGETQKLEMPTVAAPPPAPVVHVQPPPAENSPSPSAGRVGVIIPDSLRNSPAQAAGSSLEPFTVPEQTALSLLLHRVEPDYPAQAGQQHLEGPVVLQAWIAKDGSVRDLKLVKGYFLLGRAALDAVRQWRFKAYTQNGKAIDFQTQITLNFKYPGQAAGQ